MKPPQRKVQILQDFLPFAKKDKNFGWKIPVQEECVPFDTNSPGFLFLLETTEKSTGKLEMIVEMKSNKKTLHVQVQNLMWETLKESIGNVPPPSMGDILPQKFKILRTCIDSCITGSSWLIGHSTQ